jgi:7-carboxy-7-deazaguanine synthase
MKRIEDYNKVLPIVELYTAVQSEGSRSGYPTVIIRTTGCTHRCFFGEGGWCDSWQTSIHAEKGNKTFQNIIDIYEQNPHIKEMMLTGGSPTMHPALVNELTHFAKERGIFITMETEGSHFLETDYPIDLISLSPKFSNSVPVVGVETPMGKIVDEKFVKQHNKFRINLEAISKTLKYHKDYHIKIVWDGKDEVALAEIKDFVNVSKVDESKIYIMPAGATRSQLLESYPRVFKWVEKNGWKMTFRPHIIAFNDERFV